MTGESSQGGEVREQGPIGRSPQGTVDFEALKQDIDPVPFEEFEEDPEYRDLTEGLDVLSAPDDEVSFSELIDDHGPTDQADEDEHRSPTIAESMELVARLQRIETVTAELDRHIEALASVATTPESQAALEQFREGVDVLQDGFTEFEGVRQKELGDGPPLGFTESPAGWISDEPTAVLSVEFEEINETLRGIDQRLATLEDEVEENARFRQQTEAAFTQ